MKFKKHADELVFKNAMEDYQKEDYQAAFDKFQLLYEDQPSLELNKLIIKSLLNLNRSTEVEIYINEFKDAYQKDDSLKSKIINYYLDQKKFMVAREYSQNNLTFKKIIQKAELDYQKDNKLVELEKQLAHISMFSNDQKSQILESALKLPAANYLTAAKVSLKDAYLNQFYKTSILLQLMNSNISEKIELLYIDKNIEVNLADLSDPFQNSNYLKTADMIYNRFGNDDPIKYQQIMMELNFQIMLMFPKIDDILNEPIIWLDACLEKLYGETNFNISPDQDTILNKISRINEMEFNFFN
ncbi:hypothetical protein [Lentilactobacillus laojiaonis]|uniref:hypothetical protein n=1 Tax=Lentilactobacillus laojiaonis TaxID=2883998 RepID=UPI001D0AD259|nr:hypothetical protein [Lentilactobacillus laojiaonis]UDM32517.1 hypothetical protein LHL71_02025 [Lentilactobacillus laojiaonis]